MLFEELRDKVLEHYPEAKLHKSNLDNSDVPVSKIISFDTYYYFQQYDFSVAFITFKDMKKSVRTGCLFMCGTEFCSKMRKFDQLGGAFFNAIDFFWPTSNENTAIEIIAPIILEYIMDLLNERENLFFLKHYHGDLQ